MAVKTSSPIFRPELLHFWGALSIYVGLAMLPCALLEIRPVTPHCLALVTSAFAAIFVGLILRPTGEFSSELKASDGFVMVTVGWLIGIFWASLPYILSGVVTHPVNAAFESVSGLTTTGATIFTDIEALPQGILLWRSMTQWLGGMGIIVIAVAILPALGIGGQQLFSAEVPGLSVERLSPRIAVTARLLWGVYSLITLVQILLHWRLGYGMSLFDAANHAFTTMSTGGFSTRNASIAAFSTIDQWIVIVFMFIAGANFTLHYRALTGNPITYRDNEEFRFFSGIIVLFAGILCVALILSGQPLTDALRNGLFQTVSLTTTTGFVSDDYELWPAWTHVPIWIALFLGGCGGSTSGGIKQARWLCLWKSGKREVDRLSHPRGVFLIKLDGKSIPDEVTAGVMGFFAFYILTFFVGAAALSFTGLDFTSALSSAAASLGNVGPGLGDVGATDNYASLTSTAKMISAFLMLVGRLELMTVFVVLAGVIRSVICSISPR